MNLPNKLTLSRFVLTIIFIFLINKEGMIFKVCAAFVFATASLTDLLDGYYAKKKNLITDFGKLMDPIADKFLMLSAFFTFVHLGVIAAWAFWLIALREITITTIRLVALAKGRVLAAEGMGKLKTVLQIFSVFVVLVYLILQSSTLTVQWPVDRWTMWQQTISFLMIGVVAITLLSAVTFLLNNRKISRVG